MELALLPAPKTPMHLPVRGADSRGHVMEQWGLCVACDRWFYCGAGHESPVDARCPACDQPPVAIRETWEA